MKYEFKGTQGKWSVDGFNTTSVIANVNEVEWKHICNCNYGCTDREANHEINYYNAHLVAAAPELLAACIEANEVLQWMWDNFQKDDSVCQSDAFNRPANAIEQIKSAIEKALNINQ